MNDDMEIVTNMNFKKGADIGDIEGKENCPNGALHFTHSFRERRCVGNLWEQREPPFRA